MTASRATVDRFYQQHPPDEKWAAVDKYALSHLHPPSRSNHSILQQAAAESTAKGLQPIASPTAQAKFFALQCQMLKARHVLEFGTLGGYTAIWLATENPQLRVTTLEYNPHTAAVAKENFAAAGVSDRVECIVGPALDAMPQLYEDVASGRKAKIDFAFVDADKSNNWNYFDWAVKMARPGACIVVDNVVLWGYLAHEKIPDEWEMLEDMLQGAREVVEKVGRDERVEAMVMQTVGEKGYDGFLMAVVK